MIVDYIISIILNLLVKPQTHQLWVSTRLTLIDRLLPVRQGLRISLSHTFANEEYFCDQVQKTYCIWYILTGTENWEKLPYCVSFKPFLQTVLAWPWSLNSQISIWFEVWRKAAFLQRSHKPDVKWKRLFEFNIVCIQ